MSQHETTLMFVEDRPDWPTFATIQLARLPMLPCRVDAMTARESALYQALVPAVAALQRIAEGDAMRDSVTVTKEAKAVKEQIATTLHLLEHRKAAHEAMGALRENIRIMQLLSDQLLDADTAETEASNQLVFQLMQRLRLPNTRESA